MRYSFWEIAIEACAAHKDLLKHLCVQILQVKDLEHLPYLSAYDQRIFSLPHLLDFLSLEKRQILRTAAFPKLGNGNQLKISLRFPLDFLAGKPKNAGSVYVHVSKIQPPHPQALFLIWRSHKCPTYFGLKIGLRGLWTTKVFWVGWEACFKRFVFCSMYLNYLVAAENENIIMRTTGDY